MNFIEIFNESSIMVITYLTIPYSNYLSDPYFKYNIGWLAIAIFCVNLFSNIAFIVI